MRVVGLGSEIVECGRIGRLIEKHGEDFLHRVFTHREIRHCSRRTQANQHYAARWACKQAVLQALGLPADDPALSWQDMEVRGGLRTGLRMAVAGFVKEHCRQQRVCQIAVSASFVRSLAIAQALVLARDKP